ncbi:NTTRR-F1 domain [Virgibacillus soli]|uniref:NTTRR-F1 domain n=1 Tax=Paracerasibacillus soli TaxID=480284 RepID=A0ABU5CXZ1_9BACI|nr:NTTRR-F1 domain [Virgibacillus soli]MDY0410350.1 NTTRR-F1 domain [Virgibacillus soli]
MAINNLLLNGGFEDGNLDNWSATNTTISDHSHTGNFSARFRCIGSASLSQTVPISNGRNYQLLISLAKSGILPAPSLVLRVTFLNEVDMVVGNGTQVNIPANNLPNVFFNTWHHVYQITEDAPPEATQAKVQILKFDPNNSFYSSVLIDDVQLLDFEASGTMPPGPTGPTGPTGANF